MVTKFAVTDSERKTNIGEKVITIQAADKGSADVRICLLFPKVGRPNASDVEMAISQISGLELSFVAIDAGKGDLLHLAEGRAANVLRPKPISWLELVYSGLTFSLRGIGDGAAVEAPLVELAVDCDAAEVQASSEVMELCLGAHIAAGGASMPIVRALFNCARLVIEAFPSCKGVCWSPSRILTSPDYFSSIAAAWEKNGAFPSSLLVGVRPADDGALQTLGLSHFTGQELRLEPEIAADNSNARQLAERIISFLALNGSLDEAQIFAAPDGSNLSMEPSGNGRIVRVWRA